MKTLYFIVLLIFCLGVFAGCRNVSPEITYLKKEKELKELVSIYVQLNKMNDFGLYLINSKEYDVQVFWVRDKIYKRYASGSHDLISDVSDKFPDSEEFMKMIGLMKQLNSNYITKSYLKGGADFYVVVGLNSSRTFKDLQYVFLNGQDALPFIDSADMKRIDENVYFRYAKAPGD